MTDNSSWLKRLLIKTEKRVFKIPSLWTFIKRDTKLYTMISCLWFLIIILVLIHAFSMLDILPEEYSPLQLLMDFIDSVF